MRYLFLLVAMLAANVCFAGFNTPIVTGVSPNTGGTVGGTSVTITGSFFTGATAVHFGANAAVAFTVNSDTQVTATSPAAPSGTGDVTVTGPGGTSATTAADQFTYAATPVRLQDFEVR